MARVVVHHHRYVHDAEALKRKRDVFAYMAPKTGKGADEFAQCVGCRDWRKTLQRCFILGPAVEVGPGDSCDE